MKQWRDLAEQLYQLHWIAETAVLDACFMGSVIYKCSSALVLLYMYLMLACGATCISQLRAMIHCIGSAVSKFAQYLLCVISVYIIIYMYI